MIQGHYFDGITSSGLPATLTFDADGMVRVAGAAEPVAVSLSAVKISDRVGNITRRISLPGGASFETADNDGVDAACEAAGLQKKLRLIHWFESRWQVAAVSLVAVALFTVGFIKWGVPAVADWAADVIPVALDRSIGNGTLEMLDRVAFEPTDLADDRVSELRSRFGDMTGHLGDGHDYRLEFRDGGMLGANAFALPSGIVVVTDQLVALSHDDEEIVAVLAHEIGHVRGRHALRQLLQAAGVSAMAMALLGDVSTLSGVLSAAPALLHAQHSRDFEREADGFAREWLTAHDIPVTKFDAILCRMTDGAKETAASTDFFATHPATSERADCRAGP